ncbi:MAG: zinc ribbon domain-containing protein [Thermoleophilaceae bacterium]|nr:zinc ribbon domain-containing protein [Thermoleophilaceae bacterium]
MPTYEYQCRECGETFSRRENIADHGTGTVSCPKCQSGNVDQRLTGFYARTPRKS